MALAAQRLILALNCGSSSLKYGVYSASEAAPRLLCEGEAEEIGSGKEGHAAALDGALESLARKGFSEFWAAGHRVVHGGPAIRDHQLLTREALAQLRGATPFAPLHLPAAVQVIGAVTAKMASLTQVICLDSAFHRDLPEVARTYPLPRAVRDLGVQRYGFHGLSLESILAQLEQIPSRVVVAHLGSGASVTAILNGRSGDTTMGLTPTGGFMMGTRCGDLDPGVLVFLLRHGFASADALEDLVNRRSGLLGISGIASDVRTLLSQRDTHEADLALKMFCYEVRKAIASVAAGIGGIDLLVFTGGIGEHAADLRNDIENGLRWLGDFKTLVLPAQEDLQIARITARLGG